MSQHKNLVNYLTTLWYQKGFCTPPALLMPRSSNSLTTPHTIARCAVLYFLCTTSALAPFVWLQDELATVWNLFRAHFLNVTSSSTVIHITSPTLQFLPRLLPTHPWSTQIPVVTFLVMYLVSEIYAFFKLNFFSPPLMWLATTWIRLPWAWFRLEWHLKNVSLVSSPQVEIKNPTCLDSVLEQICLEMSLVRTLSLIKPV
jgi:hypothetical protein